MIFRSKNLEDTEVFIAQFIEKLGKNETYKNQATLICLSGDLGAGKTTFTQIAARKLGLDEHITSPTFVIEKNYKLKDQVFKNLIHIDAYRLKSGEELKHLGWDEILNDPQNIIFLEWPENIKEVLPKNRINLRLEAINENEHLIEILE